MGCYGPRSEEGELEQPVKYNEESQKTCIEFERTLKLSSISWKTLLEAIDSTNKEEDISKYLAAIFKKAGLEQTYNDNNIRLKEVVEEFYKSAPFLIALIIFALLMCSGSPEEKFKKFSSLLAGEDEILEEIPERKFNDCLACMMKLSIEIIPKYAGKNSAKDYEGVQPEKYIRNWWRLSLYAPILKANVKLWFLNGKFTTTEARDAALRVLVPEIPQMIAPNIENNNRDGEIEEKKLEKKYEGEWQKQCLNFEEKTRLADIEWTILADAGEFFKPKSRDEPALIQELMKVVTKAGLKNVFNAKSSALKKLLLSLLGNEDKGSLDITLLALMLCKGRSKEKFDGLWKLMNDRDENSILLKEEVLKKYLTNALDIAVNIIPKQANTHEQIDFNLEQAATTWWGKAIEKITPRNHLKGWFLGNQKFTTSEARAAALSCNEAIEAAKASEKSNEAKS